MFDSVFVEKHPLIEAEQREYLEYLDSFAEEGAL